MRVGELVPLSVCRMVSWVRERCLPPDPLPLTACTKPGLRVKTVGKLTLYLTDCTTWESRSSTSPEQHSRSDFVDQDAGDLAPCESAWEMWPHSSSAICWSKGEMPFPILSPSPLVVGGRAGPDSLWVQHLGEWALQLTWATQ